MINYDDVTNENMNKHDLNWPQIPDHPCRILIFRDSRSRKTNDYLIYSDKTNKTMMIIALLIKHIC